MLPVVRELAARRRPGQHRHHARGGRRGRARGRRRLVNDVSGGLADPAMAASSPRRACRACDALARAQPTDMHDRGQYGDVVAEVRAELRGAASTRSSPAGVDPEQLVARPGPRASPSAPSTTGRCWPASTRSSALGCPVLVGASRKRFLGALLADADGAPRPAEERDAADGREACSPRRPAHGACACTTRAPRRRRARRGRRARLEADDGLTGHPTASRRLGMRARGHHGVFDHEREHGQTFVVDAVAAVDTAPPRETDDLAATVNYGELAARCVAVIEGRAVDLVETLARGGRRVPRLPAWRGRRGRGAQAGGAGRRCRSATSSSPIVRSRS